MSRAIFTKDILACVERLKAGHLVAIPTETVYGLAADAWNEQALEKIFAAKERPKDDPLIIHVKDFATAMEFWNVGDADLAILRNLAKAYWPGPLTMVAKAHTKVPSIVTAGTGMVAVRSPALMEMALLEIPFAAPSANKFGHVSPTTAQHVYDDLQNEDVWILESAEPCRIGVESTVIQVSNQIIQVLRHGQITKEHLSATSGMEVIEKSAASSKAPHVAPGQTMQHYSPNLPSFLIDTTTAISSVPTSPVLSQAVVLDIHEKLSSWKSHAAYYRSLGDSDPEIAQNLFDCLRWAEQQDGAKCVLFPKLSNPQGILEAVADRLHRAASGNVLKDLQSLE